MTGLDQQGAFDQQARAQYHHAASTLSPALQGRLRAARRTALAKGNAAGRRGARREPGTRQWPVLPLAAMAAAVFALAIGLRWPRGADSGQGSPPGTSGAPAVAVQTVVDPGNPQLDAGKPDVPDPVVPDVDLPDTVTPDAVVSDADVPDTGVPDTVTADPAATERVAVEPQVTDTSRPNLSPEVDPALLVLEEDPDFYLWLGEDDALPASLEPAHDAT